MARGKKGGPSRMDLRRQAEAAEARDGEEVVEAAEDEEEEGDDEGEAEAEAGVEAEVEAEAEPDAEEGDDDEEGVKKKKKKKPAVKKKAAPKAKKPATKRVRAAKEVRQRAVWVVFDNASKRIDTFAYNQKAEAEALLARKIQEKEGKATFYLNLVKEELKDEAK